MKTAVITGASRGIGRALAIYLSREGFNVACVGRDRTALDATAERVRTAGQNAWVFCADFAKPVETATVAQEIAENIASIDLAVMLASPAPDPDEEATLGGTDTDQIIEYANVVFTSQVLFTKQLQPALAKSESSTLIYFSTDWALRGSHGPAAFSGAKAGISHFARSIRRDFAEKGIQVTSIYPGDIATYDADWIEAKWDIDDPVEEVVKEFGGDRIPLLDVCEVVSLVAARKHCRIEEIVMAPRSGEYDY
ncbi:SDR family NAD(P)-dependent oxidoreductase [Parasphingorhabdus sp.]|uniref:SDR family NAD(P)-dependent oxidoreductase n=1 Tax=Parasphingorhabdus sp. TaxID=2709688 RepID=UPI0035945502